jgi:hypothetical protein
MHAAAISCLSLRVSKTERSLVDFWREKYCRIRSGDSFCLRASAWVVAELDEHEVDQHCEHQVL